MSGKGSHFFRTFTHFFRSGMARKVKRQEQILGETSQNLSLFEHIQQLRVHVMKVFLWLMGFTLACFAFMSPLISYLKKPYDSFMTSSNHAGISQNLTSINIFEVMTVNFKICFFVGFAASLPILIYELWKFVSPALYPSEKKIAKLILFCSLILFYSGLAFGYYLIIPYFFQSALAWASHYANVMITYESYFNTLTTMLLIFAVVFEVPVVISLLGLAGVLPSHVLAKNRKICFLACFILGAILAPPDVVSLCLVALPMYFMVEVSIYCLKRIEKKKIM